jgi:hypothetical protein
VTVAYVRRQAGVIVFQAAARTAQEGQMNSRMDKNSKPRGIYRTLGGFGSGEDSARVDDGTKLTDMSRITYLKEGYKPPFEQLPWDTINTKRS